MRLPDDRDDVGHSLIPLTLAVGLVRHKVYADRQLTDQGRERDFDVLAGFMAATVPLYEYPTGCSKAPRTLRAADIEGGLFRNGAKQLTFLDGRATKRDLAVSATDVECVIALLREASDFRSDCESEGR